MVAPGDEFVISAGVLDNMPGGRGRIRVEVQSGPELTAAGPVAIDLDLAGKKEAAVEFRFKANATPGSASLRFSARRGDAVARIEDNVSVRQRRPIGLNLHLGASITPAPRFRWRAICIRNSALWKPPFHRCRWSGVRV